MIAFGPVPSRRLGRSLGVNNIPDKVCSYACVYCQIGRTLRMEIERRTFYEPEFVFEEVSKKVEEARERGERIDYVTFAPDGEPTLDANLGLEVELLRDLDVPLAILTNSSLIWREDVRNDLLSFDLVSLKLDAVREEFWRRIDRPHKSLSLKKILDGMLTFRDEFDGKLVTETMLVNVDYGDELERIAAFLAELRPNKAYIAIPTRPPAEKWVGPASEETINLAYQLFSERLGSDRVEYLIGYEGNAFASTGNVVEDILSITAVHPMREEALKELLERNNADWDVIESLLKDGRLIRLNYRGDTFYMRALPSRKP